jgi:cystathionine beta-synthase
LLGRGSTIVEPTSGNTGVALAMVAAQRGYHCIFTMPDKIAEEKRQLLRAFGAKVVICPTAVASGAPRLVLLGGQPDHRVHPGCLPTEPVPQSRQSQAHEASTGPEIWRQTAGRITHFVAGVGTGGTISGVGRYLKAQNPASR